MNESIQSYSLGKLKRLFSSLPSPPDEMRKGSYRGTFIGPWWMRIQAPAFTALTGLPGWQGKKFVNPDLAVNVLLKGKALREGPQMRWVRCTSQLDGKASVALRYDADGPVPWRWVTDELRLVDATTILGMSVFDLPGLRSIGLPFLLIRET